MDGPSQIEVLQLPLQIDSFFVLFLDFFPNLVGRFPHSFLPCLQLLDTVNLDGIHVFLIRIALLCLLQHGPVAGTHDPRDRVFDIISLQDYPQILRALIAIQGLRISVEHDSFEQVVKGLR